MKRFDIRTIGALLLIVVGILILLQNFGILGVVVGLVWALIFAVIFCCLFIIQ